MVLESLFDVEIDDMLGQYFQYELQAEWEQNDKNFLKQYTEWKNRLNLSQIVWIYFCYWINKPESEKLLKLMAKRLEKEKSFVWNVPCTKEGKERTYL